MAKRWNIGTSPVITRAKRLATRWGLQAGIISVGAVLAAGQLSETNFVGREPVVRQVVEAARTPRFAVTPAATAPAAEVAALRLDAGLDHASIDRWERKLATPSFARLLQRKERYEDMITRKLDERGMPRDLIYLAMIESEFNPDAKSPVKAVGMWQFMAATARQFGLTVRGKVDERRNPERATDAALTYLASLKERLGSWYLAAAAYNSGEGTVRKALRRTTGDTKGTDADFFRIMPRLPKETRDYVPKLIAASRVGNAPAQYGVLVSESAGEVDTAPAEVKPAKQVTPAKKKQVTRSKRVAKAAKVARAKKAPVAKRKRTTTTRRATRAA